MNVSLQQLSKTWFLLPSVTVEVGRSETLYIITFVSIAVYVYGTFHIEGKSLSSESSTGK